ncbi:hypothetical protein [Kineosporia sp. NBRC 101731]|uniref:hypothetical protein n=1 Tax=Kineosporia sp. NBRC 101731 TaxID=3032199 RepID=UPI0024A4F447|nr:hypothetical protein [Kineosporia sp. NBRC 101731]GLY29787.1 hypothetical protein Kisp02_31520 [Kineosporia sp. NBRC 101731]
MDDLKDILDRAVLMDDAPVDPSADLARARGQLRRRRMTRAGAGAAGLVVIAAVGGVLSTQGTQTVTPVPAIASAPAATTAATKDDSLPGIALVAYTGEQVPGYQVGFVPKGWEIQGGSSTVLAIAPKGFKNQDINQWVGKIAVLLQSKDAAPDHEPVTQADLEAWGMEGEDLETTVTEVTVNGHQAWLTRPKTPDRSRTPGRSTSVSVDFTDDKGHNIVVQGPSSLNWNDTQWLKFAQSVKVLSNAEAGLG